MVNKNFDEIRELNTNKGNYPPFVVKQVQKNMPFMEQLKMSGVCSEKI
jgi:hypothetical protein